jgi:hypothetical protein
MRKRALQFPGCGKSMQGGIEKNSGPDGHAMRMTDLDPRQPSHFENTYGLTSPDS